jgi:hypothetical protein
MWVVLVFDDAVNIVAILRKYRGSVIRRQGRVVRKRLCFGNMSPEAEVQEARVQRCGIQYLEVDANV